MLSRITCSLILEKKSCALKPETVSYFRRCRCRCRSFHFTTKLFHSRLLLFGRNVQNISESMGHVQLVVFGSDVSKSFYSCRSTNLSFSTLRSIPLDFPCEHIMIFLLFGTGLFFFFCGLRNRKISYLENFMS